MQGDTMARKIPALGPSDRSDTPSDRPGKPGTDTDSGGTGERVSIGKVPHAKDEGADRVVDAEEAGLGGGLDQAEEAQLGITDEELAKKRKR
jgi:hypothetical protein